MPIETEKTGREGPSPEPSDHDFRRAVSISTSPGNEFVSGGGAPAVFGFLALGVMGLVYILALPIVRLAGAPIGVAIAVPLIALVAFLAVQVRPTDSAINKEWAAQFGFGRGTDTRFRVRVVIPPRRTGRRLRQWALRLAEMDELGPPTESDLRFVQGGFEPVVARAWFAVRRTGAYQRTVLVATLLVGAGLVLYGWFFLGAQNMLRVPGGSFLNMAAFVTTFVAGSFIAEALSPTYVRVSPGRLDVFEYALLARGKPSVTTYQLAPRGLCVHFGRHAAAIEPTRPFEGESEPPLVSAKSWPYPRIHQADRRPDYLNLTLTPGRREILCRLVQAALYDGEPIPLPDDELTA